MAKASTNEALLAQLETILGRRHLITAPKAMERFCKGFRSGSGQALAVAQPGSLREQWEVLKACVAADVIVIMQAANTGLTEGSTPKGSYDRPVVVISTKRLDKIMLLQAGEQIVSWPGATLFALEKRLKPLGRQPHSVIGSSCIGASIVGCVCNNSGGALVERGPSYTEMALYAQIDANGKLHLINHLGLDLGDSPEDILARLEAGDFDPDAPAPQNKSASDKTYCQKVRAIDEPTPARFNADQERLYEAAGCAGKLAVFAVRLDTYPMSGEEKVFYIGTNETQVLTRLRRDILNDFNHLPVSGEYMHADCYDISERYGKDTLVMIDKLGTERLPTFFALKGAIDARLNKIAFMPNALTDRVMQGLAALWPKVLPKRMRDFRARFDHHLILKMRDGGIQEARDYLSTLFAEHEGEFYECSAREGKIAGLHRFAAAGAAIRYQAVNPQKAEDIIALDIALRRNDRDWFEVLPKEIDAKLVAKLYYGHFFCHVLHQDYIVKKGADVSAIKEAMLAHLDARGAEYPAEHNVGHLYEAKPALQAHYTACDPTNSLNPGLGKMSRRKHYS